MPTTQLQKNDSHDGPSRSARTTQKPTFLVATTFWHTISRVQGQTLALTGGDWSQCHWVFDSLVLQRGAIISPEVFLWQVIRLGGPWTVPQVKRNFGVFFLGPGELLLLLTWHCASGNTKMVCIMRHFCIRHHFSHQAGVRNLQKHIERICRKLATKVVEQWENRSSLIWSNDSLGKFHEPLPYTTSKNILMVSNEFGAGKGVWDVVFEKGSGTYIGDGPS